MSHLNLRSSLGFWVKERDGRGRGEDGPGGGAGGVEGPVDDGGGGVAGSGGGMSGGGVGGYWWEGVVVLGWRGWSGGSEGGEVGILVRREVLRRTDQDRGPGGLVMRSEGVTREEDVVVSRFVELLEACQAFVVTVD